jgi:ribosomal small subunit protein bTHX
LARRVQKDVDVTTFSVISFNQILSIMGKGDKKTRRGKIIRGSYGVRRPKAKNKTAKN